MATIELLKNLTVGRYEFATFNANMVGKLVFEKIVNRGEVTVKCTNTTGKLTETVVIDDMVTERDGTSSFSVVFATFGIIISGEAAVALTHTLLNTDVKRMTEIANTIVASDIYLRAAVPVDVNIPFGTSTLPAKADADLSLGDYQGWVLYKEPSADDLLADTSSPNNMWQPVTGDWDEISRITSAMIPAIRKDRSRPLTLPEGNTVQKFDYVWGEYEPITDGMHQKKFTGDPSSIRFVIAGESTLALPRLNVYLNGIYQDVTKLEITKNVIACDALSPRVGDTITVIYKAYAPSKAELAFDPDATPGTDNPVQTVQYKYDYQYTSREVRNSSGALVNTLYYFWVANKNLTTRGRALSLQSAKSLLKVNTNPYAVLQNISEPTGAATPSYNQFIGMGLNRYITEDNTYKIRFTRDFILRDDPKDIELKNVHTEWAMIREQQNTLIPEKLWNHLVDAACGQNMIGDAVPSLARVAYDERNGTAARYGFGDGQAFVDQTLAMNSIKYAILNTALTTISPANPGVAVPDPIEFIDHSELDALFATAASTRKTMNDIWTKAKPKQVNEIFFTVLYDALAENYEFTDIFKTSMIAAHSIRLFSNLDASNEN